RTDTGEHAQFSYDRLLIATGVKARIPEIPGTDLKNVFSVVDLQDALRIKEAAKHVKRVAVIGAGYVGLEMVESLQKLAKTIHLYEREPQVLPNIDADMAQIIEYELRRFGVNVSISAKVLALTGSQGAVNGIKTATGLGIDPA